MTCRPGNWRYLRIDRGPFAAPRDIQIVEEQKGPVTPEHAKAQLFALMLIENED